MTVMGSSDIAGYCAFTKAIEHLADRWSLLIVRELGVFGPQGFSELANGLPGRISRSVLAERLRRLEALGLVSRTDVGARHAKYQLTGAGTELIPTILSLRGWASTWMPDDPGMIERDPDVVLNWLARRLDPAELPDRQVILEIRASYEREHRYWLVLARDAEPYGCLVDPLLDESRYVYLHAGATALLALARGSRGWAGALADGSVRAYGDPALIGRLVDWFQPADPDGDRTRIPARTAMLR